jgi:lipid-binding SYLF domain-containing protein
MRKSLIKPGLASGIRLSILAIVLAVLSTCSTLSPEGEGPTRTELDAMSEKAISTLLETKPELQPLLEKSVGYAVVKMSITKIPVIGTGAGYGVVVDKRNNTRSYIQVSQFEVGGGMGAEKFKVLIVFSDEKLVDRAARGTWHYEAGADAVAGSDSAETATSQADNDSGYKAYKLSESGACVRVTVRVARAKPYLLE